MFPWCNLFLLSYLAVILQMFSSLLLVLLLFGAQCSSFLWISFTLHGYQGAGYWRTSRKKGEGRTRGSQSHFCLTSENFLYPCDIFQGFLWLNECAVPSKLWDRLLGITANASGKETWYFYWVTIYGIAESGVIARFGFEISICRNEMCITLYHFMWPCVGSLGTYW